MINKRQFNTVIYNLATEEGIELLSLSVRVRHLKMKILYSNNIVNCNLAAPPFGLR